jgi:hypothetical protein
VRAKASGMTAEDFAQICREERIALLVEQQATIAALPERISRLEKRRGDRAGPGRPGNKPASGKPSKSAPVRPKRAHVYSRPWLPRPRRSSTTPACADCWTHLVGGWVQATREVLAVPVIPAQWRCAIFVRLGGLEQEVRARGRHPSDQGRSSGMRFGHTTCRPVRTRAVFGSRLNLLRRQG